jgi:CRP-like cAMP-binding protein
MAAFDVLRAYFLRRAAISDEELALMNALFVSRALRAGDFLQRAGEPAEFGIFVASGCLRSYVIDSKGIERIVQFAPEEWWLSDIESLSTGKPSQYFIDAIEDSEVMLLSLPAHGRLIREVPGYAASLRDGLARHAAAKDKRIVGTLTRTAEERYQEFLETYPSIALRVPQWMLASYLGISPETVSRIRARASRRATKGPHSRQRS